MSLAVFHSDSFNAEGIPPFQPYSNEAVTTIPKLVPTEKCGSCRQDRKGVGVENYLDSFTLTV